MKLAIKTIYSEIKNAEEAQDEYSRKMFDDEDKYINSELVTMTENNGLSSTQNQVGKERLSAYRPPRIVRHSVNDAGNLILKCSGLVYLSIKI